MREVTNECVGCTSLGLHCLGSSCPNRNVVRYYCDKCKEEFEAEELYVNENDEELCSVCILNEYSTVAELRESEE